MSTAEQRFEVPPEYADVYERAYRRAYEDGQNQVQPTSAGLTPRRLGGAGTHIAIPQQRSGGRRARVEGVRAAGAHASAESRVRDLSVRRQRPVGPGAPAGAVVARAVVPVEVVADRATSPAVEPVASRRRGHRAAARRGSTVLPLLGLTFLLALLLVGAFLLGRVTADTVSLDDRSAIGSGPGALASLAAATAGSTAAGTS